MNHIYHSHEMIFAIKKAAEILSERKEEINRLNVFPIPDGDTGTNMSLTVDSVVENINTLAMGCTKEEICKTITSGALMGARGNSGVITSQIFRGLCEGALECEDFSTKSIAHALACAEKVAFKAVRKPVEGTILTVLRDMSRAGARAAKKNMSVEEALDFVTKEAYASVQRTPEFLPVLKENGVVDSGGYGLAILCDAFVGAMLSKESRLESGLDFDAGSAPKVKIEQLEDWDGSDYMYCTEFLVLSDSLDVDHALDFLSELGDCELVVGSHPNFKVHVHTDTPDKVLAYMLSFGQISEVHVHNMKLQSQDRNKGLIEENEAARKDYGFVAVATGSGNAEILKSLGVDVVISGGQTMNPSTKDIVKAVEEANANCVYVFPNNKNIIMSAQSAAEIVECDCMVVPTINIAQSFSAMFCYDETASADENLESFTTAASEVKSCEITTAIKDSKDANKNPIANGDKIGIIANAIQVVESTVEEVALKALEFLQAEDHDSLTILAGEDYSDKDLEALIEKIEEIYPDLEIDPHRGEQPLYPIILAVE